MVVRILNKDKLGSLHVFDMKLHPLLVTPM